MIYVIGSINIDLVMKTNHMPQKGETMHGEKFFINQGGKGANQAVAIAKSNRSVHMIGAVGTDGFGDDAIRSLQAYGVSTTHVHRVSGHTGVASIWLAEHDNRILLESGANSHIQETMIDHGLASANPHDILVLQLEIPMSKVMYALKLAKSKHMMTCLNPAPYQALTQEILDLTDILCVNETEQQALLQQNLQITNHIHIETLGAQGVSIKHPNGQFVVPAYPVNVVDTTAAGDTFIGAFVAQFEKDPNIEKAARYANAAAALTVTRYGAQQSIPTEVEVIQFMEAYAHD